ncbi:hypothetical protein J437_LFUL013145, partial [Ladona fulva]
MTHKGRYVHDCTDVAAVTSWPLSTCITIQKRGAVRSVVFWTKNAISTCLGPSKHHLSRERFRDEEAEERAVRPWFLQQPKEFYADSGLVLPPPLKNEIVLDRQTGSTIAPLLSRYDSLKKDAVELETQIKQTADALDTLIRMQQRSLEASLFNKANELQEDISLKRFDLRVAQIHLAAVRAQ